MHEYIVVHVYISKLNEDHISLENATFKFSKVSLSFKTMIDRTSFFLLNPSSVA